MVTATHQSTAADQPLRGLGASEAAERRAAGAVNGTRHTVSRSYVRIIGQNLFTFLNLLIFAISGVLAALGLYLDALFAGILGTLNALIAIVQEVRAKRTLDRIAVLTRPQAVVIRDGREQTVTAADVVRDDLVVVRSGDQVVADGPIVTATGVTVDESLLTGEAELVSKAAGDLLYSGTYCMTGTAVYRADRVGADSTAERINASARAFRNVKTPLQREITWLMRILLGVILLLTLQVLGTFGQLYGGFSPDGTVARDAARAIAVLIGLVPQGLVLMISIAYAMAVIRIAGKGILAHRMNAIESLSHVDVLCLDKTGTITTNHLKVEAIHPFTARRRELEQALGIFVASSTSHNRTSAAIGDAFPGAARRVREEVPFSSERKWSGLILDDPGGGAYVLGAPESLESALSDGRGMDDGRVGAWTAQGLRVLLFAFGPGVTTFSDPEAPNLPKHLVPLGLIALRDELRQDAGETLRAFAGAGIALKIISGDHPATVTTLARQAGVEVKEDEQVITGLDLDGLDERGYERVADDAMIFARVSPSQKEKLVTALQRRGRYVAMIGDGVNDVPALKHANVAVAMRSGSDVARGIADLVLLDDAFTKLPATFHEGQRVRNGLRTTMNLFFTRTLYTILIVLVTALGGAAFPIPLRHGALVSALAVGLPAFALTIWARPGKVARRALPEVFDVVVPAGVTIAAMGLAVYHVFLAVTDDIDLAQSALTTMTMLCGFALIPFLRPPTKAWVGATGLVGDWRPTFFAGLMLIVFLGVLFVPPMQVFWELEPLPLWTYPAMVLVVPLWALTVRLLWRSCLMKRLRQFGSTGWRALVVTNTHQKPRRMTTS